MEKIATPGKKNLILTAVVVTISLLLLLHFLMTNASNEQQKNKAKPSPIQKVTNLVPYSLKTGKVPGEISIKFKTGITPQQISQELQKYNAQIIRQIPAINRTIIQVPIGQETQLIQQLKQDELIQNAEQSYYQHVFFVPNDTYFQNQWGLNNTGQVINNNVGTAHSDINAETAWDVSKGTGVKVAILDTGLDMSHPDIASKVVGQKIFVTNSLDDRFGHGTHVAGILAANTNNGQGIAGICPDCQLLIGKAMDDNGLGDTSVISQAITWAADSGAKVINLSEGGDILTQTQQDAVNYALNKGAVVVAAAGNNASNQKFYPAAMNQVVSVTAVDNNDQLATFANYGTWVTVAAPGQDIYSTLPTKNFAMQNVEPLKVSYDYLSGTSMAAPFVSGLAALIWSSPYGTSNTAVIQRIVSTADKISGTGTNWQYGRINAAKALNATATPTVTPSPTVTPTLTPTPTTPAPTLTPTAALPTSTPTPIVGGGGRAYVPTVTPIIPSYVCGGSTNSVCPTITPTSGVNIQPTLTQAPSEIALSGTQPTSSPVASSPSTIPCTTTAGTTSTAQSVTAIQEVTKKHHKHSKRKRGQPKQTQDGLLQQFLDLMNQLLNIIGQANNNGRTTVPCPTPTITTTETPSPSGTVAATPTEMPSMSMGTTPTTIPSVSIGSTPTIVVSEAPTVSPATTPNNNNNFAVKIIKFLLDFINQIISLFLSIFK